MGDKHVSEKLKQNNLVVGGEQSGHIIIKDKHVTGDGILVALHLAEMCASQNKKLSEFFDFKLFEQTAINVTVSNKEKIIKNSLLNQTKIEQESLLGDRGRIVLRVSGTEPVVRVMVESGCDGLSKNIAEKIANVVKMLDMENNSCVE